MKHQQDWLPLWSIPLMVIFAVATVWFRLAIIRTTYEITQTDRTIRELQLEKEQQEVKLAALKSPRRLELLARTRFSLSQPRADQVIHMGSVPNVQ